jgi:hypothetical protein
MPHLTGFLRGQDDNLKGKELSAVVRAGGGSTGREALSIIESIDEKVGAKYGLGFQVCRGRVAGGAGRAGICADGGES